MKKTKILIVPKSMLLIDTGMPVTLPKAKTSLEDFKNICEYNQWTLENYSYLKYNVPVERIERHILDTQLVKEYLHR